MRKKYYGHAVVCTCRLFVRFASCAHELYVRWLAKDTKVQLAELVEYTKGSGNMKPAQVEMQLRTKAAQGGGAQQGGRPIAVPAASALGDAALKSLK